jgi:uncharacterized membrane protein
MSFQERNVFTGLLVGLGFLVAYTMMVPMAVQAGAFDGPAPVMAVARKTLWIIGGSIVVTIVATILVEILYAIVTNNPDPEQLVDERDRQIERNGDRIGGHLAAVVFVGALIALAMGTAPLWGLIIITYGFYFGSMLSTLIRLYLHRRGY